MSVLIDVTELYERLADAALVIADVRFALGDPHRGRRAFQQGHIPGAVYFDLDQDLAAPTGSHGGRHPLPDVAALAGKLGRAGIGGGRHVVVYDDSGGMFAGRLWWLLRYLGFDAAQVLDGGYSAWLEADFPTTAETAPRSAATFIPRPRRELVVSMAEVRDRLEDPSTLLVDARGPERYRGESEPIDKKAGHIPSALNKPFAENLERGRFKDPAALRERFRELEEADEIIVYCGSGVSATHNLIALEVAGLKGAKLYAGSWSDWSSYEENPVATGDESKSPQRPQ